MRLTSPEVPLRGGKGRLAVSVTNGEPTAQRLVLGAFPVSSAGSPAASASWSVVERPLREVAAGATEQFLVSFDTAGAAAASYPVKLIAYSADDAPEDYSDQGHVVTLIVPAAPAPAAHRTFPWWLVAVGAALLLLVGGVVWFVTRTSTVTVPDVTGRTQASAQSVLQGAGLKAAVTRKAGSAPLGVVDSQQPAAGASAKSGATVTIVVRSGVRLSDVTKLTVAQATAKLGLDVRIKQQGVESDQSPGTVIDQSPAAGTELTQGATVTLQVATARSTVVPGVVGVPVEDVRSVFSGRGLQIDFAPGSICQASRTVFEHCQVVAQSAAPGTRLPIGSAVALTTAWVFG